MVIWGLTCWGQSDWRWCCNSLWWDARRREPGKHLIRRGPGSSPARCCRSPQRSLCCSPAGGAAVCGSPVDCSAPLCYSQTQIIFSTYKCVIGCICFNYHSRLTQWGPQWGALMRAECVWERRLRTVIGCWGSPDGPLESRWCNFLMGWCRWQRHSAVDKETDQCKVKN